MLYKIECLEALAHELWGKRACAIPGRTMVSLDHASRV